mgnify:CR=1 FL=1
MNKGTAPTIHPIIIIIINPKNNQNNNNNDELNVAFFLLTTFSFINCLIFISFVSGKRKITNLQNKQQLEKRLRLRHEVDRITIIFVHDDHD